MRVCSCVTKEFFKEVFFPLSIFFVSRLGPCNFSLRFQRTFPKREAHSILYIYIFLNYGSKIQGIMARKKTIGKRIGKLIDTSIGGFTEAISKVTSIPGDFLQSAHNENEEIVKKGQIYRGTKKTG